MRELFPKNVVLVSGGGATVLLEIAFWVYDHQEDIRRGFDAAFDAYGETRAAHNKTN
jgi:hypothetical protein